MASVIVIQRADAVPTFCLVFALPLTLLFSRYDLSMVHEASESSVPRGVNWMHVQHKASMFLLLFLSFPPLSLL